MNSVKENSAGRPGGVLLNYLSLFTSVGTLLCCALPSLLVLIGLGATVASFLSAATWLVKLSHYKNWVFIVSGLLITGNFLYVHVFVRRLTARDNACSADANACYSARKLSRVILWISATIYLIGFFSAYLLGPFLARFDS